MEKIPGLEVVRALSMPVRALDVPDDDEAPDAMPTMEVRFCAFDNWYEIDSFWEGKFLERVARGAFAKTISEQGSRVRCLFDHGFDPQIGNKVLGAPENLREDEDAAAADVPLFDTSYNRDLLPGLKAGQYGSSFRFVVVKDEWNDEPEPSDYNPRGIPERTIREVRLMEFGPVTFPANPEATAGVRSTTDAYYESLRSREPARVEELRALVHSRTSDADARQEAATPTAEPSPAHSSGLTPAQRRERLYPSLKESA